MIVHHGAAGETAVVILACNDSSIKVIADNGRLQYQSILDAAPTCISTVEQVGQEEGADNNNEEALIIIYGL